jgi:hypothetical protein
VVWVLSSDLSSGFVWDLHILKTVQFFQSYNATMKTGPMIITNKRGLRRTCLRINIIHIMVLCIVWYQNWLF